MKNSKQQQQSNILRDYDKVKKVILNPNNEYRHIQGLRSLLINFQNIHGIDNDYSRNLFNSYFVVRTRLKSKTFLNEN